MTRRSYVQLRRDDLMRLLFAVGYTRAGLAMEDEEPHEFIDPAEFDRLGDEINQQWHEEVEYHE